MAQLAPSTLHYAQLLMLVEEFKYQYNSGNLKTPDEVAERIVALMTEFNKLAGEPFSQYDPVVKGEPPLSAKMNRFWNNLENDVNIAQEQIELIRASVIFLHNVIATEVQLAKNENARTLNKLKTLQLYSSAHDSNIIQFGDFFTNEDFIDNSLTPADQRVSLISSGNLMLGKQNQLKNLSTSATIKVLEGSNGFLGNNQEILDPSLAGTNLVDNTPIYLFKQQVKKTDQLNSITDGQPNSWFEYENYLVSSGDRVTAKDFNFTYQNSKNSPGITIDPSYFPGVTQDTSQDLIDWAKGPSDNVLRLKLEFDLKKISSINYIEYTPFGLDNNINHPVKVSSVRTSANGTDWITVSPENVFITTDANLDSARASENVSIGSAVWNFDRRSVRYIRIDLEQNRPVDSKIGHLFYESKQKVTRTYVEILDLSAPGGVRSEIVSSVVGGDRVQGPIPPVTDTDRYFNNRGTVNGLVQKTEYFNGKRWAIGVRDILIQEFKFNQTGLFISKPFRVNGIIDRVALEADVFVPSTFTGEDTWIRFFVSPDNGKQWFPISRIQDDFIGIPEILAFNDPLPAEFREVGVQYHSVSGVVNSLRLKVELTRPADEDSSSPILKSYKLKVRRR